MTSYSEIIYLISAMVVFSYLSLNTAKSFNNSRQTLYSTEAEIRAITFAQDELNKLQWSYDHNDLDVNNAQYIFLGYPILKTETYGDSDQYTSTFMINGTSDLIEDTGIIKRYQIVISVLNLEVIPEIFINLEYVKSYTY